MTSKTKSKKVKKTAKPTEIYHKTKHAFKTRLSSYMGSTPHHSFRLTRRRDIPGSIKLPGYTKFTGEVIDTIRRFRMPLIKLVLILWVGLLGIVGLAQQSQYTEFKDALQVVGQEVMGGKIQGVMEIGTIFSSVAAGALNTNLSEGQQIYVGLLYIFVWLVVIWLLRHLLAGTEVSVRDGLYNAGAPLVSVLLITFLGVLQLLPGAIGVMIFAFAQQGGLLVSGIEVAVFFLVALLLVVLSLYWVTSTFFAIIIATIPGTYPVAALRSARQLVVGQRRQILFRLLWLVAILFLLFAVVLIPTIVIDTYMRLSGYPFVTLVLQFMTSVLVVLASTYIYMLYRKIIDERS